jgi:hypothetical protein
MGTRAGIDWRPFARTAAERWRQIRWPIVAVLGWSFAGIFGILMAVQTVKLDDRHFHVDWGNVPGWVSAVGTFAALGALLIAARQWQAAQVERRHRQADQARLIIAEKPPGPMVVTKTRDGMASDVVICNHSDSPVFDLSVRRYTYEGGVANATGDLLHRQRLLGAGASTDRIAAVGGPDWVTKSLDFSFTDANGRRWRREGFGQPKAGD